MNKHDLRKIYFQKRSNLLPQEIEASTTQIVKNFKKLDFNTIKLAHLFYPITGKKEFNSLVIKEYLQAHYPSIKFVLPKSNTEKSTLTNILWNDDTPLAMNQWGITEPEYGTEITSDKIDLILVPLLAFDKEGNRLGYGKGFYDRFLSACRSDALKIGISYFSPEDKFEEVDVYDIPLDLCITPSKIWRFKKNIKA